MSKPSAHLPVLSNRQLNRATLARQMLLGRERLDVEATIVRLVGMQGQVGNAPYVGLWGRIEGFRQADLSDLILARRMVRATMMRGTVHMIGAEDYLRLRPLIQPVVERAFNGTYARQLVGLDMAALLAAGRELLRTQAVQGSVIGQILAEGRPERNATAIGMMVRYLLPLVHVPPAGLWDKGAAPKVTLAESWLGRALETTATREELVLRYLAGFGPASVRDAQAWSGLSRLGEVFERLRPRLVSFRNEDGWELFDLPDAPRPEPDIPAPVRMLADYDNVYMGHADRRRLLRHEHWKLASMKNGFKPLVLRDGVACAAWVWRKARVDRTIVVESFGALGDQARDEIAAEAEALLEFATPESGRRAVEFSEAG